MRIKITPDEITLLGGYIKEKSGIVLDASKDYLFESRLGTLLEKYGCGDYRSLLSKAKFDRVMSTELIDAVCTNETSFFRDTRPFQMIIHKLVPDFFEQNEKGIMKLWSAASSTGQEIYSIIMMLFDAGILPPKFSLKLVGTDISDTAIARASRGAYSKFELARGMDSQKLGKYFNKIEEEWKIKDELRAMVQFKKLNLLNSSDLSMLGRFDIVLCRNVAIYFSADDKRKLFNSIADMLNPGGRLIIGSTESMMGVSDRFARKEFRGSVYYDKVQ